MEGLLEPFRSLKSTPLLCFFQHITSLPLSLFQQASNCSSRFSSFTYQQDHALAAFEQGDWLAELERLQLANVLQRTAMSSGGYDDRAFDLMFAIVDVLEADHGWNTKQSGD